MVVYYSFSTENQHNMHYKYSYLKGNDRFISIDITAIGPFDTDEVEFQLPVWRPGRYELGFFSRNIRNFKVVDAQNNPLKFEKISHSAWKVKVGTGSIHIRYEYYANVLNGGGCWWDHHQMFINPIQCALYIPGKESEKCTVEVDVPENWSVASGMNRVGDKIFEVDDFHELVDSPFIASLEIHHAEFIVDDTKFHVWIHGDCNPDMERIVEDFKNYTKVQIKTMISFPVKEYHYLIQIRPDKYYHGVEHLKSTVIVLGPGSQLMSDVLYKNLVGVASHELFHVWNVKSIRPVEMSPYDYSKENYSNLGLVYEGVTTYYGDLFLSRSGFFSLDGYLEQLNMRLQKHMDNFGRLNYSILESSFDTWLDGYIPGIPGRKTSIYDEGCLLALCTDLLIRKNTNSEKSLDDVMRILYHDYALMGVGYTLDDYQEIVSRCATTKLTEFFENVVAKPITYLDMLNEVLFEAGLEIQKTPSSNLLEKYLGVKIVNRNNSFLVSGVYNNSPAMKHNILYSDKIISVNNIKEFYDVENINEFGKSWQIKIVSNHVERIVQINIGDNSDYYSNYKIVSVADTTPGQLNFRKAWLSA
jgi:predicted metalloprotease with PDZ domain